MSHKILFETVSAFSTVGSSLGITSSLCAESKFFLVIIMFIARVGFITVLMSFAAGIIADKLTSENSEELV